MTFGQRVRRLRRERDMTQRELGKKAGMSYVTVSRIEAKEDDDSVYLGSARRLAVALGVSLDSLAGIDEDEVIENEVSVP